MSHFFGFQGGSPKKEDGQEPQNTSGSFLNRLNHIKSSVTESISSLSESASRGNGQCAMMLHDHLTKENEDEEDRFFWARFAADAHIAMGEYETARYYMDGIGVNRNPEKAFLFAEAAMRHASEKEKTVISGFYQELEGIFVPSDEKWEQFSVEMLAGQIEEAKESGEEKDYIRLVILIKRFLSKNIGILYYWLGNFYEIGRGVRMDLDEALRLYGLAVANGYRNEEIQYRCNQLKTRKNMTVKELLDCANKSYSVGNNDPYIVFSYIQYTYYQRLGAERNNCEACFQYAIRLTEQSGVKRDYDEAVFYFKKVRALLEKCPDADDALRKGLSSKRLSFMYYLGQGVKRNPEKADYFYGEAKRYMSNPDKESSVGEFIRKHGQPVTELNDKRAEALWKGSMCTPDVSEAIRIYAQKKTVESVKMLSWIHAAGYHLGIKPDYEKAMDEFRIYKNNVKPTALFYAWQAGILLAIYNYQFMDTASIFQVHHASDLLYFAIKSNRKLLTNEICEYLNRVGYADTQGLCQRVKERIAQEENQKRMQEQAKKAEAVKEEKKEELSPLDQMSKEIDQKMLHPETQNVQMKPEIKARDLDHEWPEVDRILQLEKEEKWQELVDLGWEFYEKVPLDDYDEVIDPFEKIELKLHMDGIYAALCFKTAALHGNVTAFYNLLDCLMEGVGLPCDPFLAKKLMDCMDNAGISFEDTGIPEWIENTMEILENRNGHDWISYGRNYQILAEKLEEDHHSCMEWILYEYYRMSTYHSTNNGMVTAKLRDKFYNQRVDWEQLVLLPWSTLIENERKKERDSIRVESLDTKEIENESDENEMPVNLDSYFTGMIGMEPVKAQLEKIYQAVRMQLLREEILKERGETIPENEKGYNFILLGNPGTGKTTVARIIAKILYDIRVRNSDSFIEIERSKVVSDHVGGTENRMREILQKVEGGTLFIDEAYALYREDSDNDFGQEAIDVLMKDMEDHRNSYSVIMAGYKLPMENMIRNANSGFASRFSYKIELPDYSNEALIQMAHVQIEKQQFTCEDDVDQAIIRCISHDKLDETFGNARYIRELVNRAIENQAERLSGQGNYNQNELFVLKACDFWQGYRKEKGVKEYLEELNSLCGLASVKAEVNSLINMLNVQKEMQKRGLAVKDELGTLHMAFKGNPGTGKTTVARLLGKLYAACGVLKRGDVFIECNRADLVASYQGQTADKVKKVVQSALGGILFIDEAYSLVQSENDSFGMEALNELLAEMENNRDSLIVIFAGYKEDIDQLFEKNPGLRSRVPKDLFFEDYSLDELNQIALNMFQSQKVTLTPEAEEALRELLFRKTLEKDFSNARGVRNTVDQIRRNQAARISNILMSGEKISDEMLLTIRAEDIRLVE